MYFDGSDPHPTLFRAGTTWRDVLTWIQEAVGLLDTQVPTGRATSAAVMLSNGMTVKLQMDHHHVYSIFCDPADQRWGFDLDTDVKPYVP
jgi:hypothetical protein